MEALSPASNSCCFSFVTLDHCVLPFCLQVSMPSLSLCAMPAEVLANILRFVPCKERIASCSGVNKQLCKAATAATTDLHIDLNRRAAAATNSLLAYLARRGRLITSLNLRSVRCHLHQLLSPSSSLR